MNLPHEESNSQCPSRALYRRAQAVMPGGVSRNTVFRTPYPLYADHGAGCYVTDLDGVRRIDFSNNMASLIHGHAHPDVTRAVSAQLAKGTAFTMSTEAEVKYAELLCKRVATFDKIRFVNSGTEAVMVAIKAARCVTGRPKIVKVEGAYHGTYDYAEVSQTSAPENWGDASHPTSVPVAAGTPERALADVVIIPFNDVPRSLAILDMHASEIACILIDPLPHRVGLIQASRQYVAALYDWTRRHDALFVFDEVITFRSQYGGAQAWYDVVPDITTLGKIIGGGFPVGALAGRDEIMSVLDPAQATIRFPHSGTFSANPITMTAGYSAMTLYDREAVERLNRLADRARQGITSAIAETGVNACVTGGGSLLRVHLKPQPPVEYRSAYMNQEESNRIAWLVNYLLERGLMMINTCSAALSTPMTESEIDELVDALRDGFRELG